LAIVNFENVQQIMPTTVYYTYLTNTFPRFINK